MTEITYRNLTILPKSRRVYLDKKEAILVNKEFELLLFLAENPNLVFSKDTLLTDSGIALFRRKRKTTGTANTDRTELSIPLINPKPIACSPYGLNKLIL